MSDENYTTRVPNRNKQLGLKIKEELYWEIKKLALQKRCRIVEVIEESVNFLSKRERERERERDKIKGKLN